MNNLLMNNLLILKKVLDDLNLANYDEADKVIKNMKLPYNVRDRYLDEQIIKKSEI